MSESSLVGYTKLCNNISKVANKQNIYIIPHCYVGQVTAKRGVDAFYNRNNASCQYVVGTDMIGQSVREEDRAWTTGGDKTIKNSYGTFTGRDMDFQSVTLEIACDSFYPYAITNDVRAMVINLMADIAKRNNMGELKWKADVNLVGNPSEQNVLVHRWFASKSCPGDAIYNDLGEICRLANEVNRTGIPYVPIPIVNVAKPTLYKGCRGANTKLLQQNLMAVGIALPKYGADGDFGDETRSGVIAFQKMVFPNESKEWDGIYGNKSYSKMNSLLNK